MPILIGILIVTNLYTLNSLMELKKNNPDTQTAAPSISKTDDNNLESREKILYHLEEQKKIINKTIEQIQNEWSTASDQYLKLRNHIHSIENQIMELKKTIPEKFKD